MSETPKCTSWFGHKFEARYSSEGSNPDIAEEAMSVCKTSHGVAEIMGAEKVARTYHHDICVRCGFVIEPVPHSTGEA